MSTALTVIEPARTGGALAHRIEVPALMKHLGLLHTWSQASYDMFESLPFPPRDILAELESEADAISEPLGRDRAAKAVVFLLSGLPPRTNGTPDDWVRYMATLADALADAPTEAATEAVLRMRLELKFPPAVGELTEKIKAAESETRSIALCGLDRMKQAQRRGKIGRDALGRYRWSMASPEERERMQARAREREQQEQERRRAELAEVSAAIDAHRSKTAPPHDDPEVMARARQQALAMIAEAEIAAETPAAAVA